MTQEIRSIISQLEAANYELGYKDAHGGHTKAKEDEREDARNRLLAILAQEPAPALDADARYDLAYATGAIAGYQVGISKYSNRPGAAYQTPADHEGFLRHLATRRKEARDVLKSLTPPEAPTGQAPAMQSDLELIGELRDALKILYWEASDRKSEGIANEALSKANTRLSQPPQESQS